MKENLQPNDRRTPKSNMNFIIFFLMKEEWKFIKNLGERGGKSGRLWLHYLPCERTYATAKNATDIYTHFTPQTSTNVWYEPIRTDEVMVMHQCIGVDTFACKTGNDLYWLTEVWGGGCFTFNPCRYRWAGSSLPCRPWSTKKDLRVILSWKKSIDNDKYLKGYIDTVVCVVRLL